MSKTTVKRGCDFAWGVKPGHERALARAIKAEGFHFVARYLGRDTTKVITAAEVQAYKAEGLGIVVVYEDSATWMLGGAPAGHAAAALAKAQLQAAGAPDDAPVYFADDFAIVAAQIPALDACVGATAADLGVDRNGVYGPLAAVTNAKHVSYRWQTVAWSSGKWSPSDNIRQYATSGTTDGVQWDVDTAMTDDYGQWQWPEQWETFTVKSRVSLFKLAGQRGALMSTILRKTAIKFGRYDDELAHYVNRGNLKAAMPVGVKLRVPVKQAGARQGGKVKTAASKSTTATKNVVKTEPVMTAAGVLAVAGPLVSAIGGHTAVAAKSVTTVKFVTLAATTVTQAPLWSATTQATILTILTGVASIYAAVRTKPIKVTVLAGALSTIATASAAFGLHVSPTWLGGEMPIVALVAGLLLRMHVSPRVKTIVTDAQQIAEEFSADLTVPAAPAPAPVAEAAPAPAAPIAAPITATTRSATPPTVVPSSQ